MRPTLHLQLNSAILSVLGRQDLGPLDSLPADGRRKAEIDLAREVSGCSRVFTLNQVHGDTFFEIDQSTKQSGLFLADGDALYTAMKDTCLLVRTADCLPLFFVAEGSAGSIIGLVHAGWRGVVARIVEKILTHIAANSDTIEKWTIAPGPCISGKNYEVSDDVGSRFSKRTPRGEKFLVDLIENVSEQWQKPLDGVQIELIDTLGACTVDQNLLFYSHRKGDTGRNLNLIYKR
ncbi:MAG: polyphenol oxidase family protein [Leptospirales bacterium]|nr:polyphenol oxidase family protein [Leptospirales bacterium]